MGDIIVKTKVGEYIVKDDLLYTKTDEWVRIEGDIVTLGITDYAQKKLRYIVNVELPEKDSEVKAGSSIVTLESVKTVADVYSPFNGKIVEVNTALLDEPDLINKDPYGKGWIVKIKVHGTISKEALLTPQQYADKIKKEEEK